MKDEQITVFLEICEKNGLRITNYFDMNKPFYRLSDSVNYGLFFKIINGSLSLVLIFKTDDNNKIEFNHSFDSRSTAINVFGNLSVSPHSVHRISNYLNNCQLYAQSTYRIKDEETK